MGGPLHEGVGESDADEATGTSPAATGQSAPPSPPPGGEVRRWTMHPDGRVDCDIERGPPGRIERHEAEAVVAEVMDVEEEAALAETERSPSEPGPLDPIVGVLEEGREVLAETLADAETIQEAAELCGVPVRVRTSSEGYHLRAWGEGIEVPA